MSSHPCRSCGACCAAFRVTFHWTECDDARPKGVPVALVEALLPHRVVMTGTTHHPVRCVALEGQPGSSVSCGIHAVRPSPCRDFRPSFEDGTHHEACDRARALHRWTPLVPTLPDEPPTTDPVLPQAA